MPVNVLLCRWQNGWHEVIEPQSAATYFRHEAFLSLGALQDIHEVERVASMQLSAVAWPRDAIAADHDPIGLADRPYRSYNVGDTIIVPRYGTGTYPQRVRAITGSEDDDGNVTYAPELGDLLLEQDERTLQAVKKMIDGTLDGESPVAQPTRSYSGPIVAQSIPKPKSGWAIMATVPTWPGGSDNSDHWTADATVAPLQLVVETTITGEARLAFGQSGEGFEAIGGIVVLLSQDNADGDGKVTVTTDYPPGTEITEGTQVWFRLQQWVDNYPDVTITDLNVKVTFAGGHANVVLPWAGP